MLPFRRFSPGLLIAALLLTTGLQAQSWQPRPEGFWSLPRSWSMFTEYSPDSSHIFLGISQDRVIVAVGASYRLRLQVNRDWELSWTPEIRPLMAESDPVQLGYQYNVCTFPNGNVNRPCTPKSGTGFLPHKLPVLFAGSQVQDESGSIDGQPYYEDYSFIYGRRWTYLGGMSPLDFTAALLPRHRVQPLLRISAGFAVSPRDIPMFDSSAFNFTFSAGGGVRLWDTPTHATQLEFRIQHLSNAYIGYTDPGIDSRLIQVSYQWSRGFPRMR